MFAFAEPQSGCRALRERPALEQIRNRGTLLVGSTGDYRPLSWHDPKTGRWEGFGIDIAEQLASELGVSAEFVRTSWPTLAADVQSDPPLFDIAIGGITVTDERNASMAMSKGYLANGKTILCRSADSGRFRSLADIDRPDVRVMVNPGGLNEAFARKKLPNARLIVHERNEDIPALVADGRADVMVTETVEASWYIRNDPRLAAPLIDKPFTRGKIGVLMRSGQDDLAAFVNDALDRMTSDGSLDALKAKHGIANGESAAIRSDRTEGFVSLAEAVPDAILEVRYYSTYNFVGERIDGYDEPVLFLTKEAAIALKAASDEAKSLGYRLKIYDAYRPNRAVAHFMRWAKDSDDVRMKPFFYPNLDKSVLFKQGYIAEKSGHSRGSTIDLTLFDMKTGKDVDMGGTFDWFGKESHPDYQGITGEQFANRMTLRRIMTSHGFRPLAEEWWHFTLENEPYPDTYFDFPNTVQSLFGRKVFLATGDYDTVVPTAPLDDFWAALGGDSSCHVRKRYQTGHSIMGERRQLAKDLIGFIIGVNQTEESR